MTDLTELVAQRIAEMMTSRMDYEHRRAAAGAIQVVRDNAKRHGYLTNADKSECVLVIGPADGFEEHVRHSYQHLLPQKWRFLEVYGSPALGEPVGLLRTIDRKKT